MPIERVLIKGTYLDVLDSLKPVGPFLAFLLWFQPWHTIRVPKEWPCAIVETYRFQTLFGNAYNLCMEPSPGFPGS